MNADEMSAYENAQMWAKRQEGWEILAFTPTQRLCQRQIYFHAQTIMFLKITKCIWK